MKLRFKYFNCEDQVVVIGNDPTSMYGVGATGSEAIEDYVDGMREYHEVLQEAVERKGLSERLEQHLKFLEKMEELIFTNQGLPTL